MTRLNISYYMDDHGKVNNDCKIKFFLLAHYMVHNFVTYNQNHYIIVLEARKTKKMVISIISLSQTYRSKIQCLYTLHIFMYVQPQISISNVSKD